MKTWVKAGRAILTTLPSRVPLKLPMPAAARAHHLALLLEDSVVISRLF